MVDPDYLGEMGVVLINDSDDKFHVQQGDLIEQLLLEKISIRVIEEVEAQNNTVRGASGFGSTGIQIGPGNSAKSGTILLANEDQSIQLNSRLKNSSSKFFESIRW